jgi:hypothetical protein
MAGKGYRDRVKKRDIDRGSGRRKRTKDDGPRPRLAAEIDLQGGGMPGNLMPPLTGLGGVCVT